MNTWLGDYVEHTKKQESPEEFHIWAGLSAIAGALGRKVWMARRSGGVTRYQIYPGQLMVVLTAGSGLVRKSTAAIFAKQYLKHIKKPIVHGKSSVEAFLRQFDPNAGGDPQVMLLESELTSFVNKASYLDPLIEVLIKMADAEDEFIYDTIGHGRIIIKAPCLTLLSCTTPESLGNRMPPSAHGAGFMSRVIFVFAKETDRSEDLSDVEDDDLSPEEMKNANDRQQRLLDGIMRINQMAGPFTFTPGGRTWFRDFYKHWTTSPAGQGEGYPARKPDHLLRIAMCFAASRDNLLQLDEQALGSARKILMLAERDYDKCFAYIGTSYAKDRQRIVDFVAAKGGKVTTTELYSAMYIYFKDGDTLRRTLNLLKEAKVLKLEMNTNTNPSTEMWSLVGLEFKL